MFLENSHVSSCYFPHFSFRFYSFLGSFRIIGGIQEEDESERYYKFDSVSWQGRGEGSDYEKLRRLPGRIHIKK